MEDYYTSVFKHHSKSDWYLKTDIRTKLNQYEPSLVYFMQRLDLSEMKILDAGCAAGAIYGAMKQEFNGIKYYGIDPDERCIVSAKKQYPEANFQEIDFLSNTLPDDYFDFVLMWNWFYLAPNWKDILKEATRLSSKYVMFDSKLRLSGPTIIDLDTSFQHYYESGERTHYIVHNVYQLLAYLHLDYLGIKKVTLYGYPFPGETSAILPLPKNEALVAGILLELYPPNEKDLVIRKGTTLESHQQCCLELNIDLPGYQK